MVTSKRNIGNFPGILSSHFPDLMRAPRILGRRKSSLFSLRYSFIAPSHMEESKKGFGFTRAQLISIMGRVRTYLQHLRPSGIFGRVTAVGFRILPILPYAYQLRSSISILCFYVIDQLPCAFVTIYHLCYNYLVSK